MKQEKLMREIAKLESKHDHLLKELSYLDSILKTVGFENGIKTIKEVALEYKNSKDN